MPAVLIAYGRYAAMRANDTAQFIYKGEGMMASVAVSRLSNGVLNYHNAGKVQASSEPQDMRLQRMLGHLTTLVPPRREARRGHRLRRRRDGRRGLDRAAWSRTRRSPRSSRSCRRSSPTYFGEHNFDVVENPKVHVQHRRRAALPADDEGEVRRHHVRSARSVGEGRGDALHAGVLRGRQGASEPRRRRHAVRAAVREQHRRR